jgi:uncharacterized caspase-like protein
MRGFNHETPSRLPSPFGAGSAATKLKPKLNRNASVPTKLEPNLLPDVQGSSGNSMRFATIACALLLICLTVVPGHAEKRVALVIGNSNYQHAGRLGNPANDAEALAALLKASGFDVVERRSDVGIAEMRRAIGDFSDTAADADIAIVYYAGHGIEVDGINYLIPTDARLARDFDVEDETISLDRVLRAMDSARRLRLVILDACRDNPFAQLMRRSNRAIGRGLARIEPTTPDTLVAFAAKAGSTASDGDDADSPFTAALLKHIATPGLDIRLALGRVHDEVIETTRRRQEPFVYGSLGGRTVSIVDAPAASVPGSSVGAPPSSTEAAQAWAIVKDTTSVAVLEAFIHRFGDTFSGDLAKARLSDVKQAEAARQAAGTAKKKADEEARAKAEADRQRLAMLQQQPKEVRKEADRQRLAATPSQPTVSEVRMEKPGRQGLLSR